MHIKVCSLLWFLFGCYNMSANQLLINVKVVDDCKHAKVLDKEIKDVKFYRGKLKKSELSSEKEITVVENNIITFTDDDSKWITIRIENFDSSHLYSLMEGCNDIEIVLMDEDLLDLANSLFKGSRFTFNKCKNLKVCSLKAIRKSYICDGMGKFNSFFGNCSLLRYVNFENMQEDIGLLSTTSGLFNPFYKCKKLIAIFVNKNAINFFLRVAPNDVYFLCYKGDKKALVENIGKKYENRIIEVDNQEDVLNFFIENKDMEKEELRKKFQDTFVK